MAKINIEANFDDSDIKEKLSRIGTDFNTKINESIKKAAATKVSSSGAEGKAQATSIDAVRAATVKLKEAQLANIEALRQSRLEAAKQKQEQADLNTRLAEGKISLQEFRLEQAKLAAEQKAQAKAARELKKQLSDNSEYGKLTRALNNVRKETKEVLAEMFSLERRGYGTGAAYEALKEKSEALTKQTQYLDKAVKTIDATVGQHQRNVGDYGRAMDNMIPIIGRVNSQLATFGVTLDELATKPGAIKELGAAFISIGKGVLSFALSPLGLLVTAVTGLFMLFKSNKQTVIDFDNGLKNVSKTTGMSGQALQILSNDIIQLSRSLKTVSANKLTEYATVAGQLGVKGSKNILAFTEALAKLETASDISGEQGGAEIARMLTLVDGGVQNVKDFGDEIVNLGNNFAASEKEILGNAEAISQNVGLYRVGRQEVLAYATATKALGIEAEVVGSTFQKTLGSFEKSIRSGKGVADILKVVGGSASDLQKRFREDASGVFQDYIKGLNDIHKAGGSVQAQMERNGITDIRQKRVIGTLAAGYDTLARAMDTVKNASGAMDDEFGTASSKIVNQQERMGIAWDNFILSIENGSGTIGKASVAIIGFGADIIEAITPVVDVTGKIVDSYKELEGRHVKLTESVSPLINKYNTLSSQVLKTKSEQDELKSVTSQIAALLPSAVTEWDKYGNAISISTDRVNELTGAQERLLAAMNKQAILEIEKDIKRQELAVTNYKKSLDEFALKGVDTIRQSGRAFGDQGNVRRLEEERKGLEEATDAVALSYLRLQEMGGKLSSEQRNLLGYFGLDKAGQGMREYDEYVKNKGKSLIDITEEESEKERTKRERAEEAAARKAERVAEQARQAVERQRALQLSIDGINDQVSRNNLSRDQQEIASVKDKYNKIREEVRKFYADPKNKGLRVDEGGLQRSERQETQNIIQQQENTRKLKQYEEDYQNYLKYEQLKKEAGDQFADEQFGKYASVVEKMKGEYAGLAARRQITGLSSADEAYFKELGDKLKAHGEKEDDERVKRQMQAVLSNQTYNEKLIALEKRFADEKLALGDSITAEQERIWQERKDAEILQLQETEAEKNKILVDGAKQYVLITTANIIAQIKVVKDLLSRSDIGDSMRTQLESNLSKLQSNLKLGAAAANLATLKSKVADLQKELVRLSKTPGANPAEIKRLNAELIKTQVEIDELTNKSLHDLFQMLQRISRSLGELGDSFSNLGNAFGNNTLSGIGDALSGIASNIDNISVAFDKNATKADKYGAAVQSLVSLVSMVANASAERKRAEEEYYRSIIQLQNEYNLSKAEQLRLESQLGESLYVKDYVGRVQDGMKSAEYAIGKYQESIKELTEKGKIANGLKNAVDWKNVGAGAASGAAIGAALGGPFALITGAIGAIVGGLVGLFGGKKKKPKYEDLYANLPKELVDSLTSTEPKDLTEVKSLLQSLNNDKAVDANTKQMIEGTLKWIEQIEKAREQVRGVVQELSGSLGNELRNKLVEAFKAGENAALAMGKTVDKVVEDMLSQLLFSKAFDTLFKDLETKLTDTLVFGDDADIIDVFSEFLDKAGAAGDNFYKLMEAAKKAGLENGMNIFSESTSANKNSLSSAFTSTNEIGANNITGNLNYRFKIAI